MRVALTMSGESPRVRESWRNDVVNTAPGDLIRGTNLCQQAAARSWFCLCPLPPAQRPSAPAHGMLNLLLVRQRHVRDSIAVPTTDPPIVTRSDPEKRSTLRQTAARGRLFVCSCFLRHCPSRAAGRAVPLWATSAVTASCHAPYAIAHVESGRDFAKRLARLRIRHVMQEHHAMRELLLCRLRARRPRMDFT